MSTKCPECGAALSEELDCQAIFDTFLASEFSDPEYGEVHFLTVACFMIQHGRYSDEAQSWIAKTLRTYLEDELSPAQLRQLAAQDTGKGRRTWQIMRSPGAPRLPRVAWSITIADVAAHRQDAASYCAWVKQWAWATVNEMPAGMRSV